MQDQLDQTFDLACAFSWFHNFCLNLELELENNLVRWINFGVGDQTIGTLNFENWQRIIEINLTFVIQQC